MNLSKSNIGNAVFGFLFFFAMVCTSNSAIAAGGSAPSGREGGNGGDAVETAEGIRFLDRVRATSTYIDTEAEGYLSELRHYLEQQPGFTHATYLPAMYDANSVPVIDEIMKAFSELNFYTVPGPIPEAGDRGLVSLPWEYEGRIVRLALQDRNGRVVVDGRIFPYIRGYDLLALFMHEAMIRVYYHDFQNGKLTSTEKIAALVKATFLPGAHLSARSVSRYLCDADITAIEQSRFGLQRVGGLRGKDPKFPVTAMIFGRDEEQCVGVDASLQSQSGLLPSTFKSLSYRRMVYSATDQSGNSLNLFLFWLYDRGGYPLNYSVETPVSTGAPFPPAFMADAITFDKMKFSMWQKRRDF